MSARVSREVAVLGGGERELEIIRGLLAAGFRVRTFGTIGSDEFAALRAGSLEEAVESVDIVVGPMPGVAVDGSLYAPHSPEKIVVDGEVFARTRPGARYFSGRAAAHTRAGAAEHGAHVHDIGADDIVQMHHAVPTAEAAICVAIQNTDMPLLAQQCLVIGYGRIGTLVARYLQGFGVRVTVAARRPEIRARAEAIGHRVDRHLAGRTDRSDRRGGHRLHDCFGNACLGRRGGGHPGGTVDRGPGVTARRHRA